MSFKENYEMLTLSYNYFDEVTELTLVLVFDKEKFILIDTGYPGTLDILEAGLKEKGLSFKSCKGLLITHHDFDHMGLAAELIKKYPYIDVYASEIDAPYISGEKRSQRLEKIEKEYLDYNFRQKAHANKMQKIFSSVEPVPVDYKLKDAQHFDWGGGTRIVATPGHLPGHISVYLEKEKLLVAGDALIVRDDKLDVANLEVALNPKQAVNSLNALLDLDIKSVVCTHGGEYKGNIKKSLKEIMEHYKF